MKKKSKISKKRKSSKTEYIQQPEVYTSDNPLFCTECDHDLDIFWLSERAKNTEAVKKNHERCVQTGKFKGELCAKMFIINDEDIDLWLKED